MKYENLSYQQMLQVLKEAAVCRLAAVYNGTPCVRPLCYTLQMDGCIPVLQLQLTHDGQLLAALAQSPEVLLEIERPTRDGCVQSVLVQGRAQIEQLLQADCPTGPSASGEHMRYADGRVTFYQAARGSRAAQSAPAEDCGCTSPNARFRCADCRYSGSCGRRTAPETGDSCPLPNTSGCACRQESCTTPPKADGPCAIVRVCASEMTGRLYAGCTVR